jgi:hypothetical protein
MSGKPGIRVEGLNTTLRALKVIDPEAMKAFRKGFKTAVEPIVSKAKGSVPDRPFRNYGRWTASADGRDLSWDARRVRRGMTTSVTASRRGAALRIVSKDPAGAIWENAGSQMAFRSTRPDRIEQARAFNRLANAYGNPPRLLVRTWKVEKGIRTTYVAVGKLIGEAEQRVQRAMR